MSAAAALLLTVVIALAGAQKQCEQITVNTDTVVGTCCLSPKNPNRPEDVRNYALHYLSPVPPPGPPPRTPPTSFEQRPFPSRLKPSAPPPRPSQVSSSTQASVETSPLDRISATTTPGLPTQSPSSTTASSSTDKPQITRDSGFVFPTEKTTTSVPTENKIAIDVPPNGCVNGGARDPSGKCVTPF